MADATNKDNTRWKVIAGIAVGALIAAVVFYNFKSGLTVSKLSVPGMMELEFADRQGLGSVAKPEQQAADPALHDNQARLENKLAELEKRLAQQPGPDAMSPSAPERTPAPRMPPDIAALGGQWFSPQGLAYAIQQRGDYITIQEMNPLLGITAVGEGTVRGQQVDIAYSTAVGTFGQATLHLSDDGRTLTGQSRDMSTGFVTNMQLQR